MSSFIQVLGSVFLLCSIFPAYGQKADTGTSIGEVDFAMLRSHATVAPLPTYPQAAIAASKEGRVSIEVYVRKDGSVTQTQIQDAADPVLASAVKEALAHWVFEPFIITGPHPERALIMHGTLVFYFRLDSGKPVVIDAAQAVYEADVAKRAARRSR
jgi:TonB family protein